MSSASSTSSWRPDGGGLAHEDARRFEPRQPQDVDGAVDRLDGKAALHRQEARETHGQPEQAGSGLHQEGAVLVEGEAEQQQHHQGVGHHLVQGDLGVGLRYAGPFAATKTASRHNGDLLSLTAPGERPAQPAAEHGARPTIVTDTVRQGGDRRAGLVRTRARTVAPWLTTSRNKLVEQQAVLGVESGVGFVEQPQAGLAGQQAARATRRRWPAESLPLVSRRSRSPSPGGQGRPGAAALAAPLPSGRNGRSPRPKDRRRGRCGGRAGRHGGASALASAAGSIPSTVASPAARGKRPAITRSRLVLPAPFAPLSNEDLAGVDIKVGAGQERGNARRGQRRREDADG